jgi:hypothetical protein
MAYDIKVTELQDSDPISDHPEGINVRLKRHQLTLLHRCREYENQQINLTQFPILTQSRRVEQDDYMRTRIGILGDHVGSGKSYVILSLILTNNTPRTGPTLRSYACNQVMLCMHDRLQTIKTSLLVIPHNLCCQWEKYISGFSERIKYFMAHKSRTLYPLMNENIPDYDLIVVTSTFYNRVASYLASKSYKMRRIIFDEVDDISIPSCASLEADFYWFVTASYGSLIWPRGYSRWDPTAMRCVYHTNGIKNSGFIKTLFMDLSNSVDKELTKILVVRNSPEYVRQSMMLPEMQTTVVTCKTPVTINILNGLVNRQIIDALNAGDISSALQHVNPSNRTTEEHIIQALINKYAMMARNVEIQIAGLQRMEFVTEAQREAEVARLRTRHEELQRRVDSIRDRVRNSDTCAICFDTIVNKCVVPCCSNSFCFECISRWLTSGRTPSCPMCKFTPLELARLMVVQDSQGDAVQDPAARPVPEGPRPGETSPLNDKLQNLEAILVQRRASGNAKFLIFSSYDNSFSRIVPVLERVRMRFATLKGNHMTINNTLRQYREGSIDVLLINAQQYGSGLNLENTTDLVLFHKFDTEIEHQVIGRAQRYGRQEPLRTWFLLYENEVTQGQREVASSNGGASTSTSSAS